MRRRSRCAPDLHHRPVSHGHDSPLFPETPRGPLHEAFSYRRKDQATDGGCIVPCRSIMENASGRATLLDSVKSSLRQLVLRPHAMLLSKPVALIFMAYGGTYLSANTVDTVYSTTKNKPATLVTSGTAKFALSSASNIGLGVYKDQIYARMFGPSGMAARAVPAASYALFTMRDCLTIFASFNMPMMLGPGVHAALGESLSKQISGQTVVQFVAPAFVQIFSTPVHLLGLDLYNRPRCERSGLPSPGERWAQVYKNWGISVVARLCRIIPAYGIGGVVNSKVRRSLMEKL